MFLHHTKLHRVVFGISPPKKIENKQKNKFLKFNESKKSLVMVNSNSDSTQVEFAIKVKDPARLDEIKLKLSSEGKILNSVLDEGEARVVLEITKPWVEIYEVLEKNGYESALVGFSDESAVSILDKGSQALKGVIRFCSIPNSQGTVVDGVIDGLEAFKNLNLSIYEYGDVNGDMGSVYKAANYSTKSSVQGRATVRTVDNNLSVSELIGRGVCCVTAEGEKVCGVIARSAGIFQNYKRICLCSGKVLWDERDLPKVVRS